MNGIMENHTKTIAKVKMINIANNTEFREKYPIYEKIYKAYNKIFMHLSCNEQCKTNLDLLAKVFSFKEVKDSYTGEILYIDLSRTNKFIEGYVDITIDKIYHKLIDVNDTLKETINILKNIVKINTIDIDEIYRRIDMLKFKCEQLDDTTSIIDKIKLVSLLYEDFVVPYYTKKQKQEEVDSLYIYTQGYSDFLFSLLNKLEVNLYAEEQS